MVVPVINKHGIVTLKGKYDAPVSIDGKRPMAFQVTLQRMQCPRRSRKVFRPQRLRKTLLRPAGLPPQGFGGSKTRLRRRSDVPTACHTSAHAVEFPIRPWDTISIAGTIEKRVMGVKFLIGSKPVFA